MSPRRATIRLAIFLWSALQLGLPGVAAVADALEMRAGAGARAHVEDTSGANCVRVHDAECVFCQLLSTSGTAPGSLAHGDLMVAVEPGWHAEPSAPRFSSERVAPLPRAPPRG